jgi:hypothetical protein
MTLNCYMRFVIMQQIHMVFTILIYCDPVTLERFVIASIDKP